MADKPIKNLTNSLLEDLKERREKGINQGIAQKQIDEPTPTYEAAASEHVIKADNNSFIVIGRDRPGNLLSGYGGMGATGAARLDFISGLASSYRNKDGEYGQPNRETMVNPSFATDAARIYISQKANIDAYMGLAEGPYDESQARSAIGIKADTVRMHARTDIKLITGRGKFEGVGPDGERLSTGGVNEIPGTISFLAGNYTEDSSVVDFSLFDPTNLTGRSKIRKLQPIPKGDNLSLALSDIMDKLKEINTRISRNAYSINKINMSMMRHTHATTQGPTSNPLNHHTVFGPISRSCFSDFKDKSTFIKDVEMMKINYLNPTFGARFINSKFVYTT
tara:strand:+ start:2394 stop:3404 length:1011 start_codon:yes stop_codon:yes gene_type:complete